MRKKSGKAPGGQVGHKGTTLRMVSNPDEVVLHAVDCCEHCAADLRAAPPQRVQKRQVIDLPKKRTVSIEHQTESKQCPHCQAITTSCFPEAVRAPIQYGTNIGAVAVYLTQQQLLPYERVAELFADVFGCPMSAGTLVSLVKRCAQLLVPIEEQIKAALRRGSVMHNDETGLYVETKRMWLHTCSTPTLTHYGVHPSRGSKAIDEINILPQFTGISVHDGWVSYGMYSCIHALCNVHNLRDLQFQKEQKKQLWAAELQVVLLDMKDAVETASAAGLKAVEPATKTALIARYTAAIADGYRANPPAPPPPVPKKGRPAQSKARNLLDRLTKRQDDVLRFLENFDVPFDNNLAERDIRMVKVQQKVSGCFRSFAGAQAFARIRGYLSTLRKQGKNLLDALHSVLLGSPMVPAL